MFISSDQRPDVRSVFLNEFICKKRSVFYQSHQHQEILWTGWPHINQAFAHSISSPAPHKHCHHSRWLSWFRVRCREARAAQQAQQPQRPSSAHDAARQRQQMPAQLPPKQSKTNIQQIPPFSNRICEWILAFGNFISQITSILFHLVAQTPLPETESAHGGYLVQIKGRIRCYCVLRFLTVIGKHMRRPK